MLFFFEVSPFLSGEKRVKITLSIRKLIFPLCSSSFRHRAYPSSSSPSWSSSSSTLVFIVGESVKNYVARERDEEEELAE